MKNDIDLHKTLKRKLNRFKLSHDALPQSIVEWQAFLSAINNSYLESDQERYILERSSETASKEMMVLNSRLKEAQSIAKIGYWYYEIISDKTYYSDEFYNLFGIPADTPPPSYEQIVHMVHPEDRDTFAKDFNTAKTEHIIVENEYRLRTPKSKHRWYQMTFYPELDKEGTLTKLTGIAMDINKRKEAEQNVASLNQQLISSARKAGMADVATSILHNVGNILNSANVGLLLLKENCSRSVVQNILTLLTRMSQHQDNLKFYLFEDEKGKLILPYFSSILEKLSKELTQHHKEIENLMAHLGHINEIIAMQQNIGGQNILIENISIKEIIATALKMSTHKSGNTEFNIEQSYPASFFIQADKSKLLQILVNIIQNAKDAIIANSTPNDKKIKIKIVNPTEDFIQLSISDSGIGIDTEDKVKIFSFGFTKKEGGHGYGLHTSALFAKELGGSLTLESEGLGKGAEFILSLPITNPNLEQYTKTC